VINFLGRQTTSLILGCILVGGLAQGCVNTNYHDLRNNEKSEENTHRKVSFWSSEAIYKNLYECVFVVPAGGAVSPLTPLLEASLERHLYEKFRKVIGTRDVKRITDRSLIQPETDKGSRNFAHKTRCQASASIMLKGFKDDFLMFWAQKSLTIEIRLKDAKTGDTLWMASHQAARSDGALPLSPLSAITSVARAIRLSGDSDQFESIVDDAVRRMAKTIPTMKIEASRMTLSANEG
jgi:hypothetical protein